MSSENPKVDPSEGTRSVDPSERGSGGGRQEGGGQGGQGQGQDREQGGGSPQPAAGINPVQHSE